MENEIVSITLSNGTICYFEIQNNNSGRQKVSTEKKKYGFDKIIKQVENLSDELVISLKKNKPKKIILELGIELGIESGEIISYFAKGSAKSNIKVTLEWTNEKVD
jgi:hypothetical protein